MHGWRTGKLSKITSKIGSGATPKGGKNSYKTEGISLIRSMNVHDGRFKFDDLAFIEDTQADKLSNVIIEPNDVLLNITGASIARCCVVPNDVLPARVNQHVSILRPNPEIIDSAFLGYLLVSPIYKQQLLTSGDKAGSTREALTKSQLQEFEISFPSLSEQKRIIAILDQAFADIDKARALTEQNLKNARELFESYLQKVFSQRGEGWTEAKLQMFCEHITVGHVGSMASKYMEKGVTFLRSQNIRPFYVSLEGVKYIDEEFNSELKKSQLKPGNVAIVRTGYPGIAAVIPESLPIANCSDLVIVKTKPQLSPHFLTLFFNSSFGKALVGANLVGAAQKHFNVTAAKNVIFAAPSIEVQEKIVGLADHFRSEVASIENLYSKKLQSLDELKRSILQKAFSGELTKRSNEVAA